MHLVKPHRTQTVSVFTPLQQLPSNRKQRELAVVTLMGPNCIFISKFKDQTESGVVYYLLLSFPSFVRRVFVALRGSFLEVRTETLSLLDLFFCDLSVTLPTSVCSSVYLSLSVRIRRPACHRICLRRKETHPWLSGLDLHGDPILTNPGTAAFQLRPTVLWRPVITDRGIELLLLSRSGFDPQLMACVTDRGREFVCISYFSKSLRTDDCAFT